MHSSVLPENRVRIMDNKALFTILRCAEQTDGQVGRSGLLKILQGGDSRKLSKLKLDHLEEPWYRRAFRKKRGPEVE